MISEKSRFNDGFNAIIQAKNLIPPSFRCLVDWQNLVPKNFWRENPHNHMMSKINWGAGGKISRETTILAVKIFRMISNSKIFSSFKTLQKFKRRIASFRKTFCSQRLQPSWWVYSRIPNLYFQRDVLILRHTLQLPPNQ